MGRKTGIVKGRASHSHKTKKRLAIKKLILEAKKSKGKKK